MNKFANIHEVIHFLEQRLDTLKNESAREFVQQMTAKLDKYGDTFSCSPKQASWLRRLAAQLGMNEQSLQKGGSKLEELKKRRAKLLGQVYQEKNKQEGADLFSICGAAELRGHQIRGASARMRHDKSYKRAFAVANPRKDEE